MPSRTTSAERNPHRILPILPVVLLPAVYLATTWLIGPGPVYALLRNEAGIEIEPKLYSALFGSLPLSLCIGLVAVLWARSKLLAAISAGLAFAVLSWLFGPFSTQALVILGATDNQSEEVRIAATFVLQLAKYIIFAACMVAAMPNLQSMAVWTWQPLVGAIAGTALLELQRQSIMSIPDYALTVEIFSAGMLAWLGLIVLRAATRFDPGPGSSSAAGMDTAGIKPASAPGKVDIADLIPLMFLGYGLRLVTLAIAIITFIIVLVYSSLFIGFIGSFAVTILFEMSEERLQKLRDRKSQNMVADIIAGKQKLFFLYLRPFETDGRLHFELPNETFFQNLKDFA